MPSTALANILSSVTEEERRHTRDRMLIAVKIADALESKGLSQKAFAAIMGKSESEISEWLSGNRNFTIDTLSDIGDCLGISLLSAPDIKTRKIQMTSSGMKVAKTRSPYPYVVSMDSVIIERIGEWNVSADQTLALV